MKRLRSSDDLDSYGEKAAFKDWGRREEDSSSHRSLMHRSSYYKSESGRKGLSSSSSRYDRLEDDRDNSRLIRKRSDYDMEGYDRRKCYDRYRENSGERGILSSSPKGSYGADKIHRSESFSGFRREYPKGFRSERDRSRREGSVSSRRRFGGGKDSDEGIRNDSESVKAGKTESDDIGKVKSPQSLKDAKSPPSSKDSGSEQSKSIETKKCEDFPVESGGNSSEMEEGELEPDPQPVPASECAAERQVSGELHLRELRSEHPIDHMEVENLSTAENVALGKESVKKMEVEGQVLEGTHDMMKTINEFPNCPNATQVTSGGSEETEATADNGCGKFEEYSGRRVVDKEELSSSSTVKLQDMIEEQRGNRVIYLEVKSGESDMLEHSKGLLEEPGASGAVSAQAVEDISENFKDKGKAVGPSASTTLLPVDEVSNANDSRGITGNENYVEGPSARGLQLFIDDPVRQPEKEAPFSNNKPKDEKLALDLSLSLPNVLLPIDCDNALQAPGSPSHARSIQSFHSSFRTHSDGFTASVSFSGSQHFTHNPSCSLTHNSVDLEQSVKSRPLFKGVDWQALSADGPKNKEVPNSQNMLPNGNGFLHQYSHASQGNSNGRAVAEPFRNVDRSFRPAVGHERQLSFNKKLSVLHSQHHSDIRSPSQNVGSHDTGSGLIKDKKQAIRERDDGSLCRTHNPDGRDQPWASRSDFVESIVTMVVSEPLNVVAQRFSEMSGQQITHLKESVRDILVNPNRQWQRIAFQKALGSRSDITLEILMKSHRAQLEILVAMSTSMQEFLQYNSQISSSDLAEIFLNLRCRNLNCRCLLPVDECDCKICSQKSGFCRDCMCLVCSRFDMASNTCSWVGCDVCLHWCHADCALRESYIRNGCSATGDEGTTEMQFHCVACEHPSEMFGFIKEVFQNFAKEWTTETLSRELQYVRKIFSASEDFRGKRLHDLAIQMLSYLENKVDLQEVQKQIICFLNGSDLMKPCTTIYPRKELPLRSDEIKNCIAGPSRVTGWVNSGRSDKAPQLEKLDSLIASLDAIRDNKHKLKIDLQASAPKEHVFDELESIVRIKHAESEMFQGRADDARREAEALKRIAITKNERIEEEYASRISKLRLADAEDMRKQKLEELQAIERAYQDYFHMKMRMETDIKDLLLKMEATRRNLTL